MVENNYIVQASLQVFTQNATTAATGVPTKATTAKQLLHGVPLTEVIRSSNLQQLL
jgi:hypothetical protein